MFARLRAWWDQKCINCYLGHRQAGKPHAFALRKAWISANTAYNILLNALNHQMSNVGVLHIKGGQFSSPMNQDQLVLVTMSLADLVPALSLTDQDEVRKLITEEMAGHNWGAVRDAAQAGLRVLQKGDINAGIQEDPVQPSRPPEGNQGGQADRGGQ